MLFLHLVLITAATCSSNVRETCYTVINVNTSEKIFSETKESFEFCAPLPDDVVCNNQTFPVVVNEEDFSTLLIRETCLIPATIPPTEATYSSPAPVEQDDNWKLIGGGSIITIAIICFVLLCLKWYCARSAVQPAAPNGTNTLSTLI